MHTYDPSRHRPTYQNPIPSMRSAPDTTGEHSATPIYDALYSEYRRSFRALPGDRTGEENMGFTAFATGPYDMRHRGDGRYDPRHDTRQNSFGQLHMARYGQQDHQAMGNPYLTALPPGPRREH
ncbi:hypothetical protein [Streptomyces sp. NPDC003032]